MRNCNFLTIITLIAAATSLVRPTVSEATLIASDSFWSTATGGDYPTGALNTRTAQAGTLGFAGTTWASGTSTILIDDDFKTTDASGLTHSRLAGTAQVGAVNFRVSHPRNASRDVSATVPLSPAYYLSGLVRANTANPLAVDLDYFAMGFFNEGVALATADTHIATGLHLGLRRNDTLGGLRLTAFGGGQFIDLGPALSNTDYLIALELTANPVGPDALRAWVAADGAPITQVLSGHSLETFSGVSDLGQFLLQQSFGNTQQVPRTWGDEIRLGTAFSDVAVIPEPAVLSLLGLGLAVLRIVRVRPRRG